MPLRRWSDCRRKQSARRLSVMSYWINIEKALKATVITAYTFSFELNLAAQKIPSEQSNYSSPFKISSLRYCAKLSEPVASKFITCLWTGYDGEPCFVKYVRVHSNIVTFIFVNRAIQKGERLM